jgi:asparagine N-glycosylation enzyme membrane subunit Stt3
LFFIFIISLYLIIQSIIDHMKRQSVDYLAIVSFITILIALIIFVPLPANRLFPASMVLALVIPVGLAVIAKITGRFQLKPFYYPVAVVVIGAIAFGIAYAISPGLMDSMIAQFGIFTPAGATGATTLEMQPFLSPQGSFSTSVAWSNFTTSFFLFPWVAIPGFAFISLAVLIYLFVRREGETRGYLHHILWVVGILIIIVALMLLMNDRNLRYLAILPLVIIIGLFFWRSRDEKPLLFFFLWTLIILMATLAQRRFAYYLVVNIALLSGYISWELVWWGGIRKLVAFQEGKQEQVQSSPRLPEQRSYYEILGITRSASRKEIKAAFRNLSAKYPPGGKRTPEAEAELNDINKAYEVLSNPERRIGYDDGLSTRGEKKKQIPALKPARPINTYYVTSALTIVAVLFLVFFPNINKSKDVAAVARFAPNNSWQAALTWLKDNSPEPFGDPDAYYQLYEPPAAGETYQYPESAYGVTAWWDYGYWITRIAHRLPSANPGQDPARVKNVADLFLSEDEDTVRELMKTMDSSYVVADYETTTSKFWAVATWAGHNSEEYIGSYLAEYQQQLRGVSIFEEAYYRSTYVRLYNFDGKAVTATKPVVITFEERIDRGGNVYRLITDADEFTDYQEAVDFVESEGTANHKIVGIDPFTSPIPLEAVDDFELVYSSETGFTRENVGLIPGVKIFKYNGQ